VVSWNLFTIKPSNAQLFMTLCLIEKNVVYLICGGGKPAEAGYPVMTVCCSFTFQTQPGASAPGFDLHQR
jgi:hypothetical protein